MMNISSELNWILADIEFISQVPIAYVQPIEDTVDKDLSESPFPGFSIPEDLIPPQLAEVLAFDPIKWVICDNGIGKLITFVGQGIKELVGTVKGVLDGIVSGVKSLVSIVLNAGKEFVDLLKGSLSMLKQFYCHSQFFRFLPAKIDPRLREFVDLPPLPPDAETDPEIPPPKQPKPNPDNSNDPNATTETERVSLEAVYAALVELRNAILIANSDLQQLQENHAARYEDLKNQIIAFVPIKDRAKLEADKAQTEAEREAAEQKEVLQKVEKTIEDIRRRIDGIYKNTEEPAALEQQLMSAAETLHNPPPRQTAIADLPPLEPMTPDAPFDVEIDTNVGVTSNNLLEFIQGLIQKTVKEVLNNNIKIFDANSRAQYQSLRRIVDAVRDIVLNPRKEEEEKQDQEDKEDKNSKPLLPFHVEFENWQIL